MQAKLTTSLDSTQRPTRPRPGSPKDLIQVMLGWGLSISTIHFRKIEWFCKSKIIFLYKIFKVPRKSVLFFCGTTECWWFFKFLVSQNPEFRIGLKVLLIFLFEISVFEIPSHHDSKYFLTEFFHLQEEWSKQKSAKRRKKAISDSDWHPNLIPEDEHSWNNYLLHY